MRKTLVALASLVLLGACKTEKDRAMVNRQWSDSFAFRISVDPTPPRNVAEATYKIVVLDKKTSETIETGEGRIFATSADGANTDDGLAQGTESALTTAAFSFQRMATGQLQCSSGATLRTARTCGLIQGVVSTPNSKHAYLL